jgi:transcriptional regulator with GAF, ATPase, and Fis domain
MSDSEPPAEETRLAPLAFSPVFRSQPRVQWVDTSGAHVKVVDGRVLVGSAQGSGIAVQHPTVSRVHAELDARADGLWIRDLDSRNGTFVDGLQVTGARVPDKTKIRLGEIELLVEYDPAQRRPVEIWPSNSFGKLVGTSVAMRELFASLARIAGMDASVLIHGETGTGKELVARAVHDASPRAKQPFVVVDCAALPENLLDAELFGHAKGAFTGAMGARIGAIEAAEGGTVFLDEIGELPISMQPKLLRVLESRTVRRVGESTHRNVDVRFISATHRDLLRMVGLGEFREDLYFRLAVIPVEVPPLRARRDDIELLVNTFLSVGGASMRVDPQVLREIVNRPWRGNVRELRNFVDRARAFGASEALAMVPDSTSTPAVTPTVPGGFDPDDPKLFEAIYKDFREAWIDTGEREYVRRLLLRHDRNVAAAAREAGVDRTYVYRLIRKHEL